MHARCLGFVLVVPLAMLAGQTQRTPRTAKTSQPASTVATSQASIDDGAKLFVAYNCVDCHGGGGSGLMAPSLADNRWRYGGTPAQIYSSIAEGRPEGMPRWGPLMPEAHLRKLVAYVQTLGTGKDVSTMNFTGAKVSRTGHD
jgi:cytochrome c oxidase cbb3-type subunit III